MHDPKDKHPAETPDVSHIHTPGVAHEESDVKVGGVALFTVGLAALMVLTAVLMWGMFNFFSTTEHRKEPPPTSRSSEKKPESGNPEEMFPDPRLQRRPLEEIERYREEEDKKLTEYEWVDPSAGVVRIPVEEAKKKLAKQGLPYRQLPITSQDAPLKGNDKAGGEGKESSGKAANPAGKDH